MDEAPQVDARQLMAEMMTAFWGDLQRSIERADLQRSIERAAADLEDRLKDPPPADS